MVEVAETDWATVSVVVARVELILTENGLFRNLSVDADFVLHPRIFASVLKSRQHRCRCLLCSGSRLGWIGTGRRRTEPRADGGEAEKTTALLAHLTMNE